MPWSVSGRAAVSLTAAALASAAVIPATGAPSVPRQLGRPRGHTVCAYTEPDFQGLLEHVRQSRPMIEPPVESAVNHSQVAWCFYELPAYGGLRVTVEPGRGATSFPYPVQSARPAGGD
ncbi:peptidase inhibitor family I36 protein [Kitasatospora sp. NPDC036755]|uniref:peptidase inhibitor family I36 protein n=1 Tax=Kitasatospora sp. NPDC036755 TaxID=3154600 RepID=UPI0033C209B5